MVYIFTNQSCRALTEGLVLMFTAFVVEAKIPPIVRDLNDNWKRVNYLCKMVSVTYQ